MHHHLREDKQDAGKEGGGGGFLRGMIDTVIGNLQLSITNIHIRYEVRRTDDAFAAGSMQEHACMDVAPPQSVDQRHPDLLSARIACRTMSTCPAARWQWASLWRSSVPTPLTRRARRCSCIRMRWSCCAR